MDAQRIIESTLAAELGNGVLRARDLEARGVPRAQLGRWVAAGELVHVGRGLYALPEREIGEHESIVHAATRVASGIVCLLSALRVYDLTTQNPSEVWLAVPRSARIPRLDWPPLRVIRWSGAALTEGVVERDVGGVTVRITTPARTVADCFKHRSKVGSDVAVEALRDYRRKRAGTIDELMEAAKVCRVHRVMQPYVEAVTCLGTRQSRPRTSRRPIHGVVSETPPCNSGHRSAGLRQRRHQASYDGILRCLPDGC